MANFGYEVSGLTDFVKVNQDVLVKSIVLGDVKGDTIPALRKQLGVKTKERLNNLDVEVILQDGSECGFNASGSTNFSEREIETAQIKVQDKWCDKDLLGKFAEYQVKIAATKDGSDMPFERAILDEIAGNINKQMEALVWAGDKSGGDLIDGFITLAKNDSKTINVSLGTNAYDSIKTVINAIPEEILDKATVFVSPAAYRALVFELVEKNLYHFSPSDSVEGKDIIFPGTEVKVHKTIGLTGEDVIYASAYNNMVYGCDMLGDSEKVRFWYDDNDELFKLSVHFNAGVQTLYPDMVVLAQ